MRKNKDKLRLWQERLSAAETAYSDRQARMDERERLYLGSNEIKPLIARDTGSKTTAHVRNICAELIEAQVNSNLPTPKVTACRKEDERKAKIIEDMLRNEMDRLPFEQLNDMMERTVPIQGGAAFLVEWDSSRRTHLTIGELTVSVIHPKEIVPQQGVYSGIEDMDFIFVKVPQTKEYIKRRYGVDVTDENESDPDIRGVDNTPSNELVTQIMAYYRNENGGIGLYSWVNDIELEDLQDYQARRLRKCTKCGANEPDEALEMIPPLEQNGMPSQSMVFDGVGGTGDYGLPRYAYNDEAGEETEDGGIGNSIAEVLSELPLPKPEKHYRRGGKVCPYCGNDKWESAQEDFEEIFENITDSDGNVIAEAGFENPIKVPYYKPSIYPLILQKNVSVYGSFLGDSDIDKIATHQNTINRMHAKIIDKLCSAGSYITLPNDCIVQTDGNDMKVIHPRSAADMSMIQAINVQANIQYDMAYLSQAYEESRQIIGITDSFQGRADRTATSGKAKEFAAAQSAGRLESKRIMKNAAYAALFEAMFKFKLAYSDEPREVVAKDIRNHAKYEKFNRFDFLERDETGALYWNDRFLFSCDTSASLAANREAMWQETRMNLQTGAFGNPSELQTLILFWSKMEELHYPGAGETKAVLEEQYKLQQQAKLMAQQEAQAQVAQIQGAGQAMQQAEMQGTAL